MAALWRPSGPLLDDLTSAICPTSGFLKHSFPMFLQMGKDLGLMGRPRLPAGLLVRPSMPNRAGVCGLVRNLALTCGPVWGRLLICDLFLNVSGLFLVIWRPMSWHPSHALLPYSFLAVLSIGWLGLVSDHLIYVCVFSCRCLPV